MTEKIKLTYEQAEVLGYIHEGNQYARVIKRRAMNEQFPNPKFRCLSDLSLEDFVKVLYVPDSYEIEPQFKVGDWVIWKTEFEEALVKINYKSHRSDGTFRFNREEYHSDYIVRHATQEEIKEEKERQLWKKLGRNVGEFREGDVKIFPSGSESLIRDFELAKKQYDNGELRGFYPTGSFVSFEEIT